MRFPSASRFADLQVGVLTFCSSTIALLAFPPTAVAELSVASESPHAAMWRKVYQQVPETWKSQRVVVVQEVSDSEMERLVARTDGESSSKSADNSVVDGCFQPGEREEEPDTITLRETLKGQEAELVFTHEYGHFVWDARLSRSQRDQYRRLWREQKRQGHLVTGYANDSAEEGFAEAFAYFLRKSASLRRRDEASWKFLNSLLPENERVSAN